MIGEPEVLVDGVWLSTVMPVRDVQWSDAWPGGTESITFTPARSHRLFRPDAIVELDYGCERIQVGTLVEPTPGQPLMAEGLSRKAEDEPAFDFFSDTILHVGDTVDTAIVRGLPWAPGSPAYATSGILSPPSGPTVALDADRVHSAAQILDAAALERGEQWGIDPATRRPYMSGWLPATLHMLPGIDGLAISRDGYASTLHGRYLDSVTNDYLTVTAHDEAARKRWGRVPRTITQPLAEGAAITTARAQELIDGLMAQGRSKIGWASPLEAVYGDVVTERGAAVDLNLIRAGQTIRLHDLEEDFADLEGQTWVDVPIARTKHTATSVIIEPRGLSSPMNDALAGM